MIRPDINKSMLRLLFISLLPFVFFSCSDVVLKPEHQPASLEINPQQVETIVGEDFNFKITILDETGQPITNTPGWTDTSFTASGEGILRVRNDTILAVKPGETTLGVKIADFYGETYVRALPRMYLTQSVQRLDGSIPVVAGRDAILRLFLQGEQLELRTQEITVRLYNDGTPFQTLMIPAGSAISSPVDEDISSVNLPIPGEYIQPGLSVTVETESGTVFPKTGSAVSFSVRQVPDFHLRFVPIRVSSIGLTGNVNSSNSDEYIEDLLDMYPIAAYQTDLHPPLTTNVSPNDNNFYEAVLNQVAAARVAEGSPDYYYYGVIPVPRRTNQGIVVGLGYIGGRAAVGWDEVPAAYQTLAHELGHNFGRRHTPCSEPGLIISGVDRSYPYPDGNIGIYGFEVDEVQIKAPAFFKDIMSYCDPVWISDYTYTGVLAYRDLVNNKQTSRKRSEEVLLVWGRMNSDEIILNPAFRIQTVPKLPAKPGSYTLSGYAEDGSQLFSIPFSGTPVSHGGRSFAFAIPVNRLQINQLAVLQVSGRGKTHKQKTLDPTQLQGLQARIPSVTAVRSGANTVKLNWKSSRYKMTMVTNSQTGEVLSFTNEGVSNIHTEAAALTLFFSAGIHTAVKQVSVQ